MSSSTLKLLSQELRQFQKSMEGFVVTADEENLLSWKVGIFGPPGTIYEGGYFKASMRFPNNYPFEPPHMHFVNRVWHPNVYGDGNICISILHPPVDDEQSGESIDERWNPTQSVRTVLLSVISLLSEPNTSSPANVDASIQYTNWKRGTSDAYEREVKKTVEESKQLAEKDGVVVPTSVEDYCLKETSGITTEDTDECFYNDAYDEYADDDYYSDEDEN